MWTGYASIFFIFSQTKQFATQKKVKEVQPTVFEEKKQQTVLSSPDSPCQTVINFLEIQFEFNWLFIHPCPNEIIAWSCTLINQLAYALEASLMCP